MGKEHVSDWRANTLQPSSRARRKCKPATVCSRGLRLSVKPMARINAKRFDEAYALFDRTPVIEPIGILADRFGPSGETGLALGSLGGSRKSGRTRILRGSAAGTGGRSAPSFSKCLPSIVDDSATGTTSLCAKFRESSTRLPRVAHCRWKASFPSTVLRRLPVVCPGPNAFETLDPGPAVFFGRSDFHQRGPRPRPRDGPRSSRISSDEI